MKKWLRFFGLSFFSDKTSKEGAKRGYTNFLLGLIIALAFFWAAYVGGSLLPLGLRYNNSPDFKELTHTVFANADQDKRIDAEIKEGVLSAKKHDGEYTQDLLINTFKSETDRQNYSVNGYNVIVDLHPADTLAEVEAYCISNDGQDLKITYEEYLSLSTVARMNFDFKLTYTGRALSLTDKAIQGYIEYLYGLNEETKTKTEGFYYDYSAEKITKAEYMRAIYELYFTNYYPEITSYESSSKVPMLRNYYYHEYVNKDAEKYLFIFDDYMMASFETKGGMKVSFYGFYSNMDDGVLVADGATENEAGASVDNFVKKSMKSIAPLTLYSYAMHIFALIPFIALMPLVVTLLAYSILKLRGVESITSFGEAFKILGSYVWFSAVISSLLTVILAFFLNANIISALPPVLFFITLAVRSIIFAIREAKSYMQQLEQEETVLTEE